MMWEVALKSLLNRKMSVFLTLMSLIVSVGLLISVEHMREQAKESFSRTVSGADLIVGARTGQLNLLLYSVFRMGNATNNISWQSYQEFAGNKATKWAIPISLGDSHRGYRVMGTTNDYFEHFRYGDKRPLNLQQGDAFNGIFDTVLGAEVARKLGYKLGDSLVLAHGVGNVSFANHDNAPFKVTGILAPTGTPVDQTVHVSLAGIEAVHMSPTQIRAIKAAIESGETPEIKTKNITAFVMGLNSKIQTFRLLRSINEYKGEPLLAILPGVALVELWQMLGMVENLLRVISVLILVSSLFGLSTMMLASMRERYRELAVLRAVGAGPVTIFMLIQLEALIVSLVACAVATILIFTGLTLASGWLSGSYGLFIDSNIFSLDLLSIVGIVIGATFLVGLIPAIGAYKRALHAGLTAS